MQKKGYNSDELHGDLSQAKREKVLKTFKNADLELLIATDVAARGLDIEGITHIFNYDIPQDSESYIHRIGRTGRAGRTGAAITLVTPRDEDSLYKIEKGIKSHLTRRTVVLKQVRENIPGPHIQVHRDAGKLKNNHKAGAHRFVHGKKPGKKTFGRKTGKNKAYAH